MTNRLATAASLYLRKHAENPIDWWPWCDEALARAKAENKPIFLSVGYSSCHWCTVMEGEAFSDAAIAEYINQNFIPIKVDREERPDLDSIYMQVLQMMVGQGGWPLNLFLAPDDLVPFYGGTYFPIEPRFGRPGFLQVLQAIQRYFADDQAKLSQIKHEILSNLQQITAATPTQSLDADLLQQGLIYCVKILEPQEAGNSFPMIPYAGAALRATRYAGELGEQARRYCQQRGLDLVRGGIYDHVGGGFHRYTVDATWTVPHFEKMLYDNGQILEYLADLWTAGLQAPGIRLAVEGTVAWLTREMMAPEGYFYAAQDADSFQTATAAEPEEGAFYVWQYNELKSILSEPELAALTTEFTVTDGGNFEGQNVLQRQTDGALSETVVAALDRLFEVRYGLSRSALETCTPAADNETACNTAWPGRIPPVTDTKMIVAWNSLVISGLARAAVAFQEPEYYAIATQAAQFMLDHQWIAGRLYRLNYNGQTAVLAQAEDYALLIKALLDLQQACLIVGGDSDGELVTNWQAIATKVQAEFDQHLWADDLGGYYTAAHDAGRDLLVRERHYADNATPAANSVAASNLVRLALLTENTDYLGRAEQTVQAFSQTMHQTPQACPGLFAALDWLQTHTLVKTKQTQIEQLAQQYWPTLVYRPELTLPAGAIGIVCRGLACREPAQSQKQLQEQLGNSMQLAANGS